MRCILRHPTLVQWPNTGGRSRHGLPVRTIHSTASTTVVAAAAPRIASPAETKRLHLRLLGVSQNESFHPKLESQPSYNENPWIPTGPCPRDGRQVSVQRLKLVKCQIYQA